MNKILDTLASFVSWVAPKLPFIFITLAVLGNLAGAAFCIITAKTLLARCLFIAFYIFIFTVLFWKKIYDWAKKRLDL